MISLFLSRRQQQQQQDQQQNKAIVLRHTFFLNGTKWHQSSNCVFLAGRLRTYSAYSTLFWCFHPPPRDCHSFTFLSQDLNFFADNMWKLGMNVTAGKFLFLGDYVDRGMQGLECLSYLFSLKVQEKHLPYGICWPENSYRSNCTYWELGRVVPLVLTSW